MWPHPEVSRLMSLVLTQAFLRAAQRPYRALTSPGWPLPSRTAGQSGPEGLAGGWQDTLPSPLMSPESPGDPGTQYRRLRGWAQEHSEPQGPGRAEPQDELLGSLHPLVSLYPSGPSMTQAGSPMSAGAREDWVVCSNPPTRCPPTWRTGSGIRNLQQPRVRRTAASRLIL